MKLENQVILSYPKLTHRVNGVKSTLTTSAFTSFPQNPRLVTTNTYI